MILSRSTVEQWRTYSSYFSLILGLKQLKGDLSSIFSLCHQLTPLISMEVVLFAHLAWLCHRSWWCNYTRWYHGPTRMAVTLVNHDQCTQLIQDLCMVLIQAEFFQSSRPILEHRLMVWRLRRRSWAAYVVRLWAPQVDCAQWLSHLTSFC